MENSDKRLSSFAALCVGTLLVVGSWAVIFAVFWLVELLLMEPPV